MKRIEIKWNTNRCVCVEENKMETVDTWIIRGGNGRLDVVNVSRSFPPNFV